MSDKKDIFNLHNSFMNNHVHRALLRDRKEKERQKEKTLINK